MKKKIQKFKVTYKARNISTYLDISSKQIQGTLNKFQKIQHYFLENNQIQTFDVDDRSDKKKYFCYFQTCDQVKRIPIEMGNS